MVLPATASHGINPLIKASLITASLNAVMPNGAVNSTGPHGTALLGTLPPNTALLGTTFLGNETYAAVAMHADGNTDGYNYGSPIKAMRTFSSLLEDVDIHRADTINDNRREPSRSAALCEHLITPPNASVCVHTPQPSSLSCVD